MARDRQGVLGPRGSDRPANPVVATLVAETHPPPVTVCPHGDPTCPCPDEGGQPGACHYEGSDAWFCPNPPLGIKGLSNPHCHVEGCTWNVLGCSPDRPISGVCGLMKLGLPPATVTDDGNEYWSMTQARPGLPGWACGWLRTPLNVDSGMSRSSRPMGSD